MHYLKIWLVLVMVTVILTSVHTDSSSASDEKTKRRCKPNVCKNGGKYVTNGSGEKKCRCVNGWTGKYCQEKPKRPIEEEDSTSSNPFYGTTPEKPERPIEVESTTWTVPDLTTDVNTRDSSERPVEQDFTTLPITTDVFITPERPESPVEIDFSISPSLQADIDKWMLTSYRNSRGSRNIS